MTVNEDQALVLREEAHVDMNVSVHRVHLAIRLSRRHLSLLKILFVTPYSPSIQRSTLPWPDV
jgi:hypothetical protein